MPRCYGVTLFKYQPALLLQHIDGVTIGERHASNRKVENDLDLLNMTADETSTDCRRRKMQRTLLSGQQREECGQPGELETMLEEIMKLTRMLLIGVKGDLKRDNFIYGK